MSLAGSLEGREEKGAEAQRHKEPVSWRERPRERSRGRKQDRAKSTRTEQRNQNIEPCPSMELPTSPCLKPRCYLSVHWKPFNYKASHPLLSDLKQISYYSLLLETKITVTEVYGF